MNNNINKKKNTNAPYVTLAQVGRVAGQSKQTWLLPAARIFRNWTFFSAVGTQTAPLPAAV